VNTRDESASASVLLTIGVPTYNRADDVRNLLCRIEEEMPERAPVEVLVSDNASEDDTGSVVKGKMGQCGLHISYHRNAENLGFDGNILQIYRRAKGQYVWFMGDDDKLEPGGIRKLVEHLSSVEPCGLVVNNVRNGLQDGGYADLVPYLPTGEKVRMRVGVRTAISDDRERLAVLMQAGQISTCVVRRYGDEVNDGPGGGHMHERLANLSLLRTPHYYITPEPIVGGGPTYWSFWFMEAVLYGVRELYTAADMAFSQRTSDLVTTQTCKAGLRLLAMRYWRPLKVNYPEIDEDMVARLKRAYGDAYVLIAHDVDKAVRARKNRKRDRLVFVMVLPFYYGLKAWQILIWPVCWHWLSLLRVRLVKK